MKNIEEEEVKENKLQKFYWKLKKYFKNELFLRIRKLFFLS